MAPTTTLFNTTPNTQPNNHNSKNKSDKNFSALREARVGATTSPGVIQPQATSPSVEAKAESIQPSPPQDGTSPFNQDKDKDERAYEHERQRAKRAVEWAKRLARKATPRRTAGRTGVSRPAVASTAHAERRAKILKGSKAGLDVDIDIDVCVLPQRKDAERNAAKMWDGLGSGLLKKAVLPPGGGDTDASKAVRVNLSDLVVSQRKPHKRNVDDFEVIPPIRSVIALDDVVNVHDIDVDEPWEHIYANDGVAQLARPTYAHVVGTGCQ